MAKLQGFQRKYLRGLAHGLNAVVLIGQRGLSDESVQEIDAALDIHELIKIKFNAFKEKAQKRDLSQEIEKRTGSEQVGLIGHTAIFYRRHANAEKRRIRVPVRDLAKSGQS